MTFERLLITGTMVIGVIVIGSISFLWVRSHWYSDIRPIFAGKVVTNPDDPKFDPMKFRFEYYGGKYGNDWDLPAALLRMFPPGTDKSYIDKILVEQADSEAGVDKSSTNRYGYRWPSFSSLGGHAILMDFDAHDKSITFLLGGNRLYESSSYRESFSPEAQEYIVRMDKQYPKTELEDKMRPVRKKYLGIEDGFIK